MNIKTSSSVITNNLERLSILAYTYIIDIHYYYYDYLLDQFINHDLILRFHAECLWLFNDI